MPNEPIMHLPCYAGDRVKVTYQWEDDGVEKCSVEGGTIEKYEAGMVITREGGSIDLNPINRPRYTLTLVIQRSKSDRAIPI